MFENPLKDFDFTLLDSDEFKEDSVREFIIAPILADFGFTIKNDKSPQKLELVLSKTLKAQIQIGSNKSIDTDLTPDYLLCVDSKAYCILDAKAPKIDINKGSKAQKQALSYMLAFECELYALCNGRKFIAFNAQGVVIEVDLTEKEPKMPELKELLTKQKAQKSNKIPSKKPDEWYLAREIPKPILEPAKQEAKRHFGCTAYFTRQSWDIVAQNIKAFTDEGDIVLDSFGGSGVTAIEAMMNNRYGIHTDLNPLSIFMVKALSAKVNLGDLYELSEEILSEFESLRPKNDKEAKALLKGAKYYPNAIDKEFGEVATTKMQDSTLWIPKDEPLLWTTKGLDSLYQLFSPKQLAELAILRKLILRKTTKQKEMRYSLLLAFYNTLSIINLTYRSTKTGGGNNFAFYYRYKLEKKPCFLDTAKTFKNKVKLVIRGKKELENSPYFYNAYFEPLQRVIKNFEGAMLSKRENLDKIDSLESKTNGERIFQADATNLKEIESQSIDFIYTDPPYGAKIPYLDLSTMWNVWLDLPVDLATREKECIEKGSLNKTSNEYYDLMEKSLKEMFRVLKYNRWLVFVFQHQDVRLWQTLRTSAQNVGFEHIYTLRQSNGQQTMKQRQFAATMVSGQLLVYFRKVKKAGAEVISPLNEKSLVQCAKEYIMENNGASFAEINDLLVTKAMNEGFLDEYLEINDIKQFVLQHFEYDKESKKYHCIEAQEPSIPLDKKTKYFLINYFNKCKKEGKPALFSDICYEVIPKLVNGVTPDNRYIKEILQEIAVVADNKTGEWKLKSKNPNLFD
ncbi:DNA methyltransferase [Helicobacter sp. T3_23-1056]